MQADDPPRSQHPSHRRRRIGWLLAGLFVAYCVADSAYFLRAMEKRTPTLKRWLPQADGVGADDRLYERHPDYLYPPVFLVLLRPLTRLPSPVAALVWQTLKYSCIVWIYWAVWRMFAPRAAKTRFRKPSGDGNQPQTPSTSSATRTSKPRASGLKLPRPADWVKVASVVLGARFIHSDLRHGNINLFIAAMVVGAGYLLVTRRGFAAGLLVSAAACVKVTPALWMAYLIYRRQWRAVMGCAVGAVLMLEIIPGAALGWERNHALLAAWRSHVIDSFVREGRVDSVAMNQSMTAVTNRLFGHSQAPEQDRVGWMVLEDGTIRSVQRGMALLILLAAGWALWGRRGDAYATAVEWALLAPVTLALSGYTWTGHFCLLIPALAGLFDYIDRTRRAERVDRTVVACAAVGAALFVFTTDLIGTAGRESASRYGLPLLGAMLLFAGLCVARRRLRSSQFELRPSEVCSPGVS